MLEMINGAERTYGIALRYSFHSMAIFKKYLHYFSS